MKVPRKFRAIRYLTLKLNCAGLVSEAIGLQAEHAWRRGRISVKLWTGDN